MINRNNYEEYFILYMDNELGEEARRMVEEFVTVHPDLKEELDILLQSKLVPDQHIIFEGKEELMAFSQGSSSINLSNYEEWLLLYTDNELNGGERKLVEDFAAENPSVKKELDLLLQTKLQPESLVFAGKASLYRKEEKVRPIAWWRMAAAAAVFIAIGTSVFVLMNKGNDKTGASDPVVVSTLPATQEQGKTASPVKENIIKEEELPAIVKVDPVITPSQRKSNPVVIKKQEQGISHNVVKKSGNPNNLPAPDENPYYKDGINSKNTAIAQTDRLPKTDLTNNPEATKKIPVTNGALTASSPSDKSIAPEYAVVTDEPDGKKNKLRGFFRKVTRTFEKRTNIETTDDDDRLLVGGLAIKLK